MPSASAARSSVDRAHHRTAGVGFSVHHRQRRGRRRRTPPLRAAGERRTTRHRCAPALLCRRPVRAESPLCNPGVREPRAVSSFRASARSEDALSGPRVRQLHGLRPAAEKARSRSRYAKTRVSIRAVIRISRSNRPESGRNTSCSCISSRWTASNSRSGAISARTLPRPIPGVAAAVSSPETPDS